MKKEISICQKPEKIVDRKLSNTCKPAATCLVV